MDHARGASLPLAIVAGAAVLIVIFQVTGPSVPSAVAFDHPWSKIKCNPMNVAEGLWDDAPGAGQNNEAAFFWVANTAESSNSCTYSTQVGNINTSEYRNVTLRVAVNDGATFLIQFGQGTTGCGQGGPGGSVFFETTITGSLAHSGFVNRNFSLPAGRSLTEICISISEQVFATGARYSALVDNIRVWNKATGAVAWTETFTAPG
jgi:hypothetical protein